MKIITIILFILFWTFSLSANENSIFWELKSPKGKQIFIFGSIHVDDNRVVDFSDNVSKAMKKSDLFVSETNSVSNLKVLEGLSNKYIDYLSEGDFNKISALSDFHSIEKDSAIKLKPWLLGFIFSSPRPMSPFSQDNLLKVTASNYGLALKGLETVDEHYSVLDSLSPKDQFQILKNVLLLSEVDKEENYELMIKTYLTFNLNKILNVDEEITKSIIPKKTWALVKKKLIHKRNKLFFKRLVILAEKNIPFVVVGSSHLAGDDGLLQQFVQAGYKKKPLKSFKE
tara:strand:+ start:338 stop:1192 length:855 start_codon:yes stop_codon:yes gene_type:complete